MTDAKRMSGLSTAEPTADDTVEWYSFEVTCPYDGEPLQHVTTGSPVAGREVGAVCRCQVCQSEFLLHLRLLPCGDQAVGSSPKRPGPAECGTDAGYRRHRRSGEKPCDECKRGHAEAEAAWQARRRRREVGV